MCLNIVMRIAKKAGWEKSWWPWLSTALSVAMVTGLPHASAADWKAPREALERRIIDGEFRIHYTLNGENAFPAGITAAERELAAAMRIGDLLDQLNQADQFYREQLGLTPPLAGDRYWDRGVRFIDIHILKLEGKKGSAGDEPILYNYQHFPKSDPTLTITLGNNWQKTNLTPGHELFHSYQYGYTYFKNAWFLEGMARSMEQPFRPEEPVKTAPLPRNREQLRDVLERSYKADLLWNRLFLLCDPACKDLPIQEGKFISPAATGFCGGELPRGILEQLQLADKEAAKAFSIRADDWPEAQQRAVRNNPYLLLGLRRALENHCPRLKSDPELEIFHQLLK